MTLDRPDPYFSEGAGGATLVSKWQLNQLRTKYDTYLFIIYLFIINFTNKEGIHNRQSLYRVSTYKNTNINIYKLDSTKQNTKQQNWRTSYTNNDSQGLALDFTERSRKKKRQHKLPSSAHYKRISFRTFPHTNFRHISEVIWTCRDLVVAVTLNYFNETATRTIGISKSDLHIWQI